MATINSYATLKVNVETYLAFDDISDMFDAWLGLAEVRMSRDVRIRQLESQVTGFNLSAGSVYALPSDFLEIIDLFETGSNGGTLDYLPPQSFYTLDASRGGSGQPAFYTVLGDELKFAPLTDSTTRSYTMNYYAKVSGLSTANTTNAILSAAPDLYLYAILFEAQPYLGEQSREGEFEAIYKSRLNGLLSADSRARQRPRGRMRADGVSLDGAFRI